VSNSLPAHVSAQQGEVLTPAVKTRQQDQWVCWWSLPIFYNLFGLIFVYLGKLMPPPKPGLTTAEIVAFIQTNAARMQVAWVLLTLSLGFASLSSGLIVVQMKRMTISPVLPYAYLTSLAVAALPGCLLCTTLFSLAAFRPERDPEIVALLYDMGLLSFVGSLGCFATQYSIFAVAIFLDKRRIFPKWLGYMSIWGAVTELVAAPIWVFRDGPYAWDGLISFYLGTIIFVVWEFFLVRALYQAIKQQQREAPSPPCTP
jgi:hypothetical protein